MRAYLAAGYVAQFMLQHFRLRFHAGFGYVVGGIAGRGPDAEAGEAHRGGKADARRASGDHRNIVRRHRGMGHARASSITWGATSESSIWRRAGFFRVADGSQRTDLTLRSPIRHR